MKEFKNPRKLIEYKHYVIYNDVKYTREETLSLKCFSWQSEPDKLLDVHTIKWNCYPEDPYRLRPKEYFNVDKGWSDENGIMDISNPIPEIEKYFKETIGKDLLYF
jgi:hypothetical protein